MKLPSCDRVNFLKRRLTKGFTVVSRGGRGGVEEGVVIGLRKTSPFS
jgi:hypothetical protein